jgi:hypothetical protein
MQRIFEGKVDADIAAIPLANIVAISIGLILLLIVIAVIIKKLGIISIGPLKLEHRGLSTEYRMNEATDAEDDICRKQMRQITNNMKINISNIFTGLRICTIAKVAISSTIRYPLFESIANNHFTTELMNDNYKGYRDRIIEMMKEEYVSLSSVSEDIQCNREALPKWDQVSKKLLECIDSWLRRISKEVIRACEKKITIYKTYSDDFKEANDKYRIDICKQCIDKNERYITVLKDRLSMESEKGGV